MPSETLLKILATKSHLVFTGLIQDIQGLHGNSLTVVMQLGDQQFYSPTTEELHTGTQQHTEVFGGIQPARLPSKTKNNLLGSGDIV